MFSYIDPEIRALLLEKGHLFQLDEKGVRCDVQDESPGGGRFLNVLGSVPIPMDVGGRRITMNWYTFVRRAELAHTEEIAAAVRSRGDGRLMPLLAEYMAVNSALVYGDLAKADSPLIRIHSNCVTGEVFGSLRCECGPQFQLALEKIVFDGEGAGALIYMSGHEGRGIGLWAKAITYLLQDGGRDTYQANRDLGLADDSRDFSDAAAMLLYLLGGDRKFRLMSNNPKKREDLKEHGLTQFDIEKHVCGVGDYNRFYLKAKRLWGHSFDDEDLK